jgi:hypothetical protein
MSQLLAPPPPKAEKKERTRRVLPWLSERDETRSVQIAAIATVLVHLILLLLIPRVFRAETSHVAAPRMAPHFNIQVLPDEPKPKPVPKIPQKFVEANPNAPENIPDKTNNFSDRNQQVAQEKPTPKGKSDMPALTGRKDIESNQIVSGSLNKPQPNVPPAPQPPTTPTPPSLAAPKRQQIPLTGTEKLEGSDPNGFGSNVAQASPLAKDVPQKVDGSPDAPLLDNVATTMPKIDPKHPRPRATLDIHARPAIFKDNQFGTANAGITACDARWSNYGVYLRRLVETVQIEWDNILDTSGVYPQPGSTVEVTFVLNSKGEISTIKKVQASAGTSDAGTKACPAAITARAPYGPWTDDMIAVLGQEQQMTFTFYYY